MPYSNNSLLNRQHGWNWASFIFLCVISRCVYYFQTLFIQQHELMVTVLVYIYVQAAAHCFEETVLLNPVSALHHVRLADVYYSIGESIILNHLLLQQCLESRLTHNSYCTCLLYNHNSGGFGSLVRARKHYAISLQHQSAQHNLRAVYGILYTCRLILGDTAATNR